MNCTSLLLTGNNNASISCFKWTAVLSLWFELTIISRREKYLIPYILYNHPASWEWSEFSQCRWVTAVHCWGIYDMCSSVLLLPRSWKISANIQHTFQNIGASTFFRTMRNIHVYYLNTITCIWLRIKLGNTQILPILSYSNFKNPFSNSQNLQKFLYWDNPSKDEIQLLYMVSALSSDHLSQ